MMAVSCSKEAVKGATAATQEKANVTFVVGNAISKVMVGDERAISSLDMLAFRQDNGILDAHARQTGSGLSEVIADVTADVPLHWHVVANAATGALDAFTTEDAFLSGTAPLSVNTRDAFVMHASGSLTAQRSVTNQIDAALDRYVSKVNVGAVRMEWEEAYALPGDVTLEKVALINVPSASFWAGPAATSAPWFNRMGIDAALSEAERSLLVKDCDGAALPLNADIALDQAFYTVPNPLTGPSPEADAATAWSPRGAKLVLEVTIGGVSNWYPIALPAMEANHQYIIERIILRGPGATTPDGAIVRERVDFTLEVLPWGETESEINFDND